MSPAGRRELLAALPFLAVSLAHLASKPLGLTVFDQATKWLLIPLLLLALGLVLLRPLRPRPPLPILLTFVLGLALSWLGDVTLANFLVGLGFFLVAHLAYSAAFALARPRLRLAVLIAAIAWYPMLLVLLAPSLGAMLVPVAVYGAIMGAMALLAWGVSPLLGAGATLFVASDSLLAFRMFTPLFADPWSDALLMGLYLAGQGVMALAVARLGARASARRAPVTGVAHG